MLHAQANHPGWVGGIGLPPVRNIMYVIREETKAEATELAELLSKGMWTDWAVATRGSATAATAADVVSARKAEIKLRPQDKSALTIK